MKICPWEIIDSFTGYWEFDSFVDWMKEQMKLGLAEELPVQKSYLGFTPKDGILFSNSMNGLQLSDGSLTFSEQWFRHIGSNQIWRLVWPDFPFKGLFESIVDLPENWTG